MSDLNGMRIPRFYEPCDLHIGQTHSLTDATTQHVSRVLRMKAGDSITLFNGHGSDGSPVPQVSQKPAKPFAIVREASGRFRESGAKSGGSGLQCPNCQKDWRGALWTYLSELRSAILGGGHQQEDAGQVFQGWRDRP